MKKLFITLIAVFFCYAVTFADTTNDTTATLFVPNDEEQEVLAKIDSLTLLLFSNGNHIIDTSYQALHENIDAPKFSDSTYAARLKALSAISPIPFVYNDLVKRYIHLFTVNKKTQFEQVLGLTQIYFPLFESYLDRHGMPMELKYLPVIESALNPHARSRVGATGLWQFMYPTAKMYGLNINSYVDERSDPVKSTEAAIRFLRDLYKMYGDWPMALAAYNCGPGNVNKAIRRSGGKMTYWEIRDYLPKETRGYVPAFIAGAYVMNYYKEHNLVPKTSDLYLMPFDTIVISHQVSIKEIANFTNTSEDIISFFNPSIKGDVIPLFEEGYCLILPLECIGAFIDKQDSIFKASDQKLNKSWGAGTMDKAKKYNSATASSENTPSATYNTDGKTKLTYFVKSGDNLGFIATWYDCSVNELKIWNGLTNNNIRVGQKLSVYVPTDNLIKYKDVDQLSFDQKQAREGKKAPSTVTTLSEKKPYHTDPSKNYTQYTIKSGDTLWDISRAYPKNSVEQIKQINNLSNASLKPGMVIKLEI